MEPTEADGETGDAPALADPSAGSPAPAPRRRSFFRRMLAGLGWIVFSALSLVASLAYHLTLPEARSLARLAIEELASDALRGGIGIGRVEELTLGRAVFTEVVITDEEGRVVISAPRVTAWPDLARLWDDGTIRIAGGRVEDADVVLYVVGEEGLDVSLVGAFQPAHPGPAGGHGPHIVIDGLDVRRATLHGDAPRYPGLRVEDLDVLGRIEIEDEVVMQVFDAHGHMVAPYPGVTDIDHVTVDFTTDRAIGLDAYVEAHRDSTRARARVLLNWPEGEEAPPHVVITSVAEPVCADTLAEMGFPIADRLLGCATGDIRLEGPPSDLALRAHLTTDAGVLDVRGRLPSEGRFVLEGETSDEGVELSRLVRGAPEMLVRGSARIDLERDPEATSIGEVTLRPEGFTVAGWDVPGLAVHGTLRDDGLEIDSLTSEHLGGTVAATGTVGFDGAIDAHIDVNVGDIAGDPNLARLVPGAHGGARGTIDLRTTAGAEDIDARFSLVFSPFRYGPVRASRLRAHGTIRGRRESPAIVADGDAEALSISSLAFGSARGHVEGRGSTYDARVASTGGSDVREAAVDAVIVRRGRRIEIDTSRTAVDLGFGLLEDAPHRTPMAGASAPGRPGAHIVVENGAAEIEGLELSRGPTHVSVRGRASARDSDLHVEVAGFDLTVVRPRLPPSFARIAGTAAAVLDLDGDLDDPDVFLSGTVENATLDGRRSLELAYQFNYGAGVLLTHLDGDLGTRGSVRVDGPVAIGWDALFDPDRALDEARLDMLEIDLDSVNVNFITPFFGQEAQALGLAGKVTVALRLNGAARAPDVPWAVLILDRIALPNWTPVRVKVRASLLGHLLEIEQAWVADNQGELAHADASLELPLDEMPETAIGWLAGIADHPWRVGLHVRERRLDGWPRPASKRLPRGVVLRADLEIAGGPAGLSGAGDGLVRWVEAATEAPCAADLRPEATFRVSPGAESQLLVSFASSSGGPATTLDVRAMVPVGEWMHGTSPTPPETTAVLDLGALELSSLPWTCSYGSGVATGRVSMRPFAADPALVAHVEVDALRVRGSMEGRFSAPFHAALRSRSEGAGLVRLDSCLIVGLEEGVRTPIGSCPTAAAARGTSVGAIAEDGEVLFIAELPIRVGDGLEVPTIELEQDLFFLADFSAGHVAPFLTWVPGITEADAVVDGTVRAEGAWETLALEGGLDVRDGAARIISMGQHLHDTGGGVRFVGNRIVIPEDRAFVAHDGDRAAALHGEILLRGLIPRSLDLVVEPDGFPFRREGTVLASLSGDARIHLDIEDDGVRGTVTTGELEVTLPESAAGGVQDLALRGDVLVIGEDAPGMARETHIRFPYTLHVDASTPFTVRRNDFEVEVEAVLDVVYDDPDLMVSGVAVIRRGEFEVLGKRFAVTRGSLTFDGGRTLNPVVDLVATYSIPGSSGATISIIANGTLSDMEVGFSSTETSDTGEILALLVSGRRSRATDPSQAQQAGEEAANFLAGLTAGVLTLGLRQQFGAVVPTIAVESGGRLGSVRARVGWDADWIIPDFLREVVLGAYVEGAVTSAGGDLGGGAGLAVSVELQFPESFVGSGTYVPPQSWGADILWEP